MRQIVTEGIILSRTNYGEADRILTLLTPDHGKLRLMAKGVRRVKSKLAGGIELFSVSTITYIEGRGEIGALISTRLVKHYGHIVEDLDRTILGYELIKQLNKVTEDQAEDGYFNLLKKTFQALDDSTISLQLIQFWFAAQLLNLTGHSPNLHTDTSGNKLDAAIAYSFNFDSMCLRPQPGGQLGADHIKFLRLSFERRSAKTISQVQGSDMLLVDLSPLLQRLVQFHIQ